MISEARDRFLRLNPPRTEKVVSALQTLTQTANKRNYEYTQEEAANCFAAIEAAAAELYEAFGLNQVVPAEEPRSQATSSEIETILRSKIDRARAYLQQGKFQDALRTLNSAVQL